MIRIRLLFLKTSLFLLVVLAYAEAQQQQYDRQQRLRQTETFVNNVEPTKKFKFGDKKPIAAQPLENAKNQTISNKPLKQQITQFDVPIIEKQRPTLSVATDDINKGQRQRAIHAASFTFNNSSLSQKTGGMQHEKRVAAVIATPPNNRSRNRGEELRNATNTTSRSSVNSNSNTIGRKQRQQYVSNITQRSSGLLTARPDSKKSAIAIAKTPKPTKTTITPATIKTTKTTTTTTTTTTQQPIFLQNNPFNIFSPEFWGFSSPTTTSQAPPRRPPKKYTPIPTSNPLTSEQKLQKSKILSKAKTIPVTTLTPPTTTTLRTTTTPHTTTTTAVTTTSTQKKDSNVDGPFRIALPTFNFFNSEAQKKVDPEKEKEKRAVVASLREKFNCPRENEVRFQLFPKICKIDEDCSVWNRDELCCEIFGAKSCVSGVAKPLEESSHSPILGLIPRKCPSRPLAELWWDVQECNSDMDCWPRVCCPDGRRRYCRTSQPELETAPVSVKRSFDYLTEYLECTPPPPPIFDLHPKACTSTFDCFPNVCCQEAGLRHCRPPKKSVLTLMANFLNVDVVKRFAQNIVIK